MSDWNENEKYEKTYDFGPDINQLINYFGKQYKKRKNEEMNEMLLNHKRKINDLEWKDAELEWKNRQLELKNEELSRKNEELILEKR